MKKTNAILQEMYLKKHEIMLLLLWTEFDYCNFQKRMGQQYLQSYISKDPAAIDALLATPIFWNWFRNQWMARDEAFVNDPLVIASCPAKRLAMYYAINNPDRLISERYPSGVVMAAGYAKMIGDFNRSQL